MEATIPPPQEDTGLQELFLPGTPQNLFLPGPQGWSSEIFGSNPWAVACTGSNKEKSVACFCKDEGIPYFLPQNKHGPIIPGVLFFEADTTPLAMPYCLHRTAREDELRRYRYVHKILRTGGQIQFKREMALLKSREIIKLKIERFEQKGRRVAIVDGPHKGFFATCLGSYKKGVDGVIRIGVDLEWLGTSCTYECPVNWLCSA